LKPKEYTCPKNPCNKILVEKQFGLNTGYFCDSHGLVRAEMYIPPAAPEPTPEEAEVKAKPKRTRKVKDSVAV
jgi:hypothetical protein